MPSETAIWFPFWYELDQSISVGEVRAFDFFKTPPERIANEGLPVFYHGNWDEKCRRLYDTRTVRILGIRHSQLGAIRSIDTNDLDYQFVMEDGGVLQVNAEETPGVVYAVAEPVVDWRVFVELESV
jgi:hypothetical protein